MVTIVKTVLRPLSAYLFLEANVLQTIFRDTKILILSSIHVHNYEKLEENVKKIKFF